MSENDDHIAIVFPAKSSLPVSKDIDAHCTLIYLGKISEASFSKEDVELVLKRLQIDSPGDYQVQGLELFGPEEDVLVATLKKDEKLQGIRDSIERTLEKIGSGNASEYKEYKPHVTLETEFEGSVEDFQYEHNLTNTVTLSEPVLWWGDER